MDMEKNKEGYVSFKFETIYEYSIYLLEKFFFKKPINNLSKSEIKGLINTNKYDYYEEQIIKMVSERILLRDFIFDKCKVEIMSHRDIINRHSNDFNDLIILKESAEYYNNIYIDVSFNKFVRAEKIRAKLVDK